MLLKKRNSTGSMPARYRVRGSLKSGAAGEAKEASGRTKRTILSSVKGAGSDGAASRQPMRMLSKSCELLG
jgi:hypothetical protein